MLYGPRGRANNGTGGTATGSKNRKLRDNTSTANRKKKRVIWKRIKATNSQGLPPPPPVTYFLQKGCVS